MSRHEQRIAGRDAESSDDFAKSPLLLGVKRGTRRGDQVGQRCVAVSGHHSEKVPMELPRVTANAELTAVVHDDDFPQGETL